MKKSTRQVVLLFIVLLLFYWLQAVFWIPPIDTNPSTSLQRLGGEEDSKVEVELEVDGVEREKEEEEEEEEEQEELPQQEIAAEPITADTPPAEIEREEVEIDDAVTLPRKEMTNASSISGKKNGLPQKYVEIMEYDGSDLVTTSYLEYGANYEPLPSLIDLEDIDTSWPLRRGLSQCSNSKCKIQLTELDTSLSKLSYPDFETKILLSSFNDSLSCVKIFQNVCTLYKDYLFTEPSNVLYARFKVSNPKETFHVAKGPFNPKDFVKYIKDLQKKYASKKPKVYHISGTSLMWGQDNIHGNIGEAIFKIDETILTLLASRVGKLLGRLSSEPPEEAERKVIQQIVYHLTPDSNGARRSPFDIYDETSWGNGERYWGHWISHGLFATMHERLEYDLVELSTTNIYCYDELVLTSFGCCAQLRDMFGEALMKKSKELFRLAIFGSLGIPIPGRRLPLKPLSVEGLKDYSCSITVYDRSDAGRRILLNADTIVSKLSKAFPKMDVDLITSFSSLTFR